MNKSYKKILKEKTNIKNIILVLTVIIILLTSTFIYNLYKIPKGNENITTKLNDDSDFLNWFIDFDKMFKQNINNINYSLTSDMFKNINNYIQGENSNVSYKENIYYIDEYNTLELDVNTRSLRHTKYNKDNKKIEILEVNLKNGKYYIQLVNTKNIYNITLNNKILKKNKIKNKGNVEVSESIYKTLDFKW